MQASIPLRVALAAAACGAVVSGPASAACPNYPYPSISGICVDDGFCGRIEPEAQATGSGDDPGPLALVSQEPVAFSRDATAGSGDLYSLVTTSVAAGRSSIGVEASVEVTAPITNTVISATGSTRANAVLRVTDLVFSGPMPDVETTLRFTLDGSFSLSATEGQDENANATVFMALGGGICAGPVFVAFRGDAQISEFARAGMSSLRNVTGTGLLEGVDLDAVTEFARGPFTVPTGVPLELELWMESGAGGGATGGNGSSSLDVSAFLGPRGGGAIFELPEGYSADSEQAGIAANRLVPAPDSAASIAAAALALGALARRRAAHQGCRRTGSRE